ncbi:MAG: amidohydrolase family protein [Hyphomicrobiales bacterium]|nr:amidohydrolase family protein [Hyphomicrobiales bacterium]
MTDWLIRGGTIVTMDDVLGDLCGDILVRNGRVAQIAPQIDTPAGVEVIEATGMIVMPGFVNAHAHLWQTGLRGIAADWAIAEYLRAMHAGLATFFRPVDIHIANLAGALNQLYCGTTTVVDWSHNNPTPEHTDAAVQGLDESGIRALFLHGSPKPDPKPGQKHFSEIPMPRSEIERLRKGRFSGNATDGLLTLGLAILGPGFGVYDVFRQDAQLAHELDMIASMHVSGPMLTPDGFQRLDTESLLDRRFNIVHGNALDDRTLELLCARGASFTVTAEVEMQMSFGRPLTGRLRKLGSPVTIGSDVESGISGDMFTVTRMTLQGQRFVDALDTIEATGKGPASVSVTCREALRWATIDGARMAGLEREIGSLSPGKAADIVLLRATDPNLFPVVDPVASIVLQAGPGNVDTVIVGGHIRKRDGKLTGEQSEACQGKLAMSSMRIMEKFRAATH